MQFLSPIGIFRFCPPQRPEEVYPQPSIKEKGEETLFPLFRDQKEWNDHARSTTRIRRMWTQAQRIKFLSRVCTRSRSDHIFREHIAFQQEGMVFFQGLQEPSNDPGTKGHWRVLPVSESRCLYPVVSGIEFSLDTVETGHKQCGKGEIPVAGVDLGSALRYASPSGSVNTWEYTAAERFLA